MTERLSRPEDVPFEMLPLTGIRKIIGQRMVESVTTAPHFYVCLRMDMSGVVALRERLKQTVEEKISFNDIVLKASAVALTQSPRINCAFSEEGIKLFEQFNVGFVTSIEDGVIVPVIRDADRKSLVEISKEVKELVERARNGKLGARASLGGTFTVSNLGMFNIDLVIPIINPPQAAILGVDGIKSSPTVVEGKVEARPLCEFWIAADHRAVDGVIAAQYLTALRGVIEQPEKLAES